MVQGAGLGVNRWDRLEGYECLDHLEVSGRGLIGFVAPVKSASLIFYEKFNGVKVDKVY